MKCGCWKAGYPFSMRVLTILRNTLRGDVPADAAAPNETCGACGQPFHCGASLRGCWCAEVQLTDAQRAHLRATHDASRCLCRPCLERASKDEL